jgi:signal transduction histidine kinase
MLPFDANLLASLLLVLECVAYIPVIALVLTRREGQEDSAYLLAIYAGLALVIQVAEVLWVLLILLIPPPSFKYVELFGVFALSTLLLLGVRTFLRLPNGRGWLIFSGAWFIVTALLYAQVFPLPAILFQTNLVAFTPKNLTDLLLLSGWAIFSFAAVLNFRQVFKQTRQPLHRNRLSYWFPVFLALIANDMLILLGYSEWGNILRLFGVLLMTYVITTHHLPDARDLFKRAAIYIITTLLILVIYLLSVVTAQFTFSAAAGFDPVLTGAVIALILATLFTPIQGAVRQWMNKLFRQEYYNPAETLREYSLRISNILDVERLASLAVGMIIESMEINRGFLFLVDRRQNAIGETEFRLRGVRTDGDHAVPEGLLYPESPITLHLNAERKPLLQYDVDLLPKFQKAHQSERAWLTSLDAEVYVPIFSKGEWIGMFAFGAKLSGNRYTNEDLTALATLSQQTAVALENARLVENLNRSNEQIRKAYAELDKTNRDLEKIDRTKTDFISIASHELRTPLTVMRGYAGMLFDAPVIQKDDFLKKMVQSMNDNTLRMHEIMESMFDIVQIDNRTMQIHMQEVALTSIVRDAAAQLRKDATTRQITVSMELPELPSIKADPNLLEKVFMHLIRNAIKFTPNGGQITIAGRAIAPFAELSTGAVQVTVIDTGVGIDPEYREVIFSKFYQPGELNKHSTGKTKFKGSGAGLGLALSKGIVEAHGGRIWVESPGYDEQKCPGSKFHVVLPLERK